jgi:hypothetical protein
MKAYSYSIQRGPKEHSKGVMMPVPKIIIINMIKLKLINILTVLMSASVDIIRVCIAG